MPVCTDCHGEHTVQSSTVPSSKTYAQCPRDLPALP
jgi:hypothetical protein